ncbi:MAG: hypothetical protein IJJ33_17875 [Victivallales bacterium]|nr:hypothetical protein [Victivallales bacterium]
MREKSVSMSGLQAVVLLCALLWGGTAQARTWYVTTTGDDGASGASWGTALASPQVAIDRAVAGDDVWIASGEYTATSVLESHGGELWSASFLLRDGVALYGGFAGWEDSVGQRVRKKDAPVWEFVHPTVLTVPEAMPGSVLVAGAECGSDTIVDGVTLAGGMAYGEDEVGRGGGARLLGTVLLRACVVRENLARDGGGVSLEGAGRMEQCLVTSNSLLDEGWGGEGGGIHAGGTGAVITNTVVENNHAAIAGGIHANGATVAFCTVVRNRASRQGSGVWLSGGRLLNSLLWGNGGCRGQLRNAGAAVMGCAIEGSDYSGGSIPLESENAGANGVSCNDNWVDGYYACFASPNAGDWTLGAGSYAINRGTADFPCAFDACGTPRVQCGQSDIGAFESTEKGNLAIDFAVAFPCVYGGSSVVEPAMGLESPEAAVAFSTSTGHIDWRNGKEWRATWRAAGFAGICLEVVPTDTDVWKSATLTRTLTVSPRPLCIAADDHDFTYGTAFPELTWEITAGTLVEGDTVTGDLFCDHSSLKVSFWPVTRGTLAISDGADGANYRLTFREGQVRYHKAETTLALTVADKTYDGQPSDGGVTSVPQANLRIIYTGTNGTEYGPSEQPPVDAGDYVVTVTVEDDRYEGALETTLTVAKHPLLIRAENASREYLMPDPELVCTLEGFVNGEGSADITVPTLTTTAVRESPAGDYPILLNGGYARNYALELAPGVLTVKPARLTVTATAETIVYGDAVGASALVGTAVHANVGVAVPGHFSWEKDGEVPGAGTHEYTWFFYPDDSRNYSVATGSITLTVAPRRVEIRADAQEQVYGDASRPLTYVIDGEIVAGDVIAGELERVPGEDAGVYAITQGTLSLPSDYALVFTGADYTILKRQVTITAADVTRAYAQPDPELTWAITEGSTAPGESFVGTPMRELGEAVGSYAILLDAVALAQERNYEVTRVPGVFTIVRAAPLLVKTDDFSAVTYGMSVGQAELDCQVTVPGFGLITGQVVWTDSEEILPVGVYERVWTFVPDRLDCFEPISGTIAFSVQPAVLSVSCEPLDAARPYRTANPEFTLLLEGFVNGEDENVLEELPAVDCLAEYDSPVGVYPVYLYGGMADNYVFEFEDGTLEITAKSPVASVAPSAEAVIRGDRIGLSGITGAFFDSDTGEEVPGSFAWTSESAKQVMGDADCEATCVFRPDNSNYATMEMTLTVPLRSYQVFVELLGNRKVYGDSNAVIEWRLLPETDSRVDAGEFTMKCVRDPGEDVGVYAVQAIVTNPALYQVTLVNPEFVIDPQKLIVQPEVSFKRYGQADPVFPWKLVRQGGENDGTRLSDFTGVSWTGSLSREPGETVGQYAFLPGTLQFASTNYQVIDFEAEDAAFFIERQPVHVTVSSGNYTCEYGDPDPVFEYSVACEDSAVSPCALVGALGRETGSMPGTYTVNVGTLALSDTVNYGPLDFRGTFPKLTIAKRALSILLHDQTWNIYEGEAPELTWAITSGSIAPGETLPGKPARAGGKEAGRYIITWSELNNVNDRYNLSVTNGYFTIIVPKLTAEVLSIGELTYGQHLYDVVIECIGHNVTEGFDFPVTYSIVREDCIPLKGTFSCNVKMIPDDPRYAGLSFSQYITITVNAQKLVIQLLDQEYGFTDMKYSVYTDAYRILEGEFVERDNIKVQIVSFPTNFIASGNNYVKPGVYDWEFLQLSGYNTNCYDVQAYNAKLVVNRGQLTIYGADYTTADCSPSGRAGNTASRSWYSDKDDLCYNIRYYVEGEVHLEAACMPGYYKVGRGSLRSNFFHITYVPGVFTITNPDKSMPTVCATPIDSGEPLSEAKMQNMVTVQTPDGPVEVWPEWVDGTILPPEGRSFQQWTATANGVTVTGEAEILCRYPEINMKNNGGLVRYLHEAVAMVATGGTIRSISMMEGSSYPISIDRPFHYVVGEERTSPTDPQLKVTMSFEESASGTSFTGMALVGNLFVSPGVTDVNFINCDLTNSKNIYFIRDVHSVHLVNTPYRNYTSAPQIYVYGTRYNAVDETILMADMAGYADVVWGDEKAVRPLPDWDETQDYP